MVDKWFISDTHFFHDNIIRYCDRPFHDAEEMNEFIVQEWNKRVKPGDKIYHLGDVGLGFEGDESKISWLLSRLNGKKRLIVGNHDNLKSPALHRFFEKIQLWNGFKDEGFTCIHIPIRLDQLRDGFCCVHGHIHNRLMKDPHYINVCVEHTNYAPLHMDEIKARIKKLK